MNEELIKQIQDLTDKLKETNTKYQESIVVKSEEFQNTIDEGKTKVKELVSQISNLRKTVDELNSVIDASKKEASENSDLVSSLNGKVESINSSLSDLEKRFVNLSETLSNYEALKNAVDDFNKKQNAIEVELINFKNKLDGQNEYLNGIQKNLDSLKETDLYKVFVENNSTLKEQLINEFIDNVIQNVQAKNAAFKSKLELEKKNQPSGK